MTKESYVHGIAVSGISAWTLQCRRRRDDSDNVGSTNNVEGTPLYFHNIHNITVTLVLSIVYKVCFAILLLITLLSEKFGGRTL